MSILGSRQTGRGLGSRLVAAVCFAIVIILFVMDFSGFRDGNDVGVQTTADGLAVKTVQVTSLPGKWLKNTGAWVASHYNLRAQNERLRAENNDLRFYRGQALDLAERISHYEDILNADLSGSIFSEKIAGRSVTENKGPFVRAALLDIGSSHGVNTGHPVLTSHGLYGRVVRTGNYSSRVLLLNDLNSRIPVMEQDTRERAMLVGRNTRRPVLEYVSADVTLRDGSRIVTSGDDGVLPRGLPVGDLRLTDNGEYEVQLFTDEAPVDWIWVYPFEPYSAPEDASDETTEVSDAETDAEIDGLP